MPVSAARVFITSSTSLFIFSACSPPVREAVMTCLMISSNADPDDDMPPSAFNNNGFHHRKPGKIFSAIISDQLAAGQQARTFAGAALDGDRPADACHTFTHGVQADAGLPDPIQSKAPAIIGNRKRCLFRRRLQA